jgi:hypothetical protein
MVFHMIHPKMLLTVAETPFDPIPLLVLGLDPTIIIAWRSLVQIQSPRWCVVT